VIGLIHDIPTCEELLTRIEKEATETLTKVSSLLVEEGQVPVEDMSSNKKPSGDIPDPSLKGGKVEKDVNNPGAELWGIGKSKL